MLDPHVKVEDMSRLRVRPAPNLYAVNGNAIDSGPSMEIAASPYTEPLTALRRCQRTLSAEDARYNVQKSMPRLSYEAPQVNGTTGDACVTAGVGQEPPKKRGPGRPRTRPLPDPNQPKRGPGRPRRDPNVIEVPCLCNRD